MSTPRIKILSTETHPTSGAFIIRYAFDTGDSGSMVFPADLVTEAAVTEMLERKYKISKDRHTPEHKTKMENLHKFFKDKEIK